MLLVDMGHRVQHIRAPRTIMSTLQQTLLDRRNARLNCIRAADTLAVEGC